MPRHAWKPKYTFPEDLFPEFKTLKALIKYVHVATKTSPAQGRFHTHNSCIIYWPHIVANQRFFQRFKQILPYPPKELSPRSRHKNRDWWQNYLKNTAEDALGRLVMHHRWCDTWQHYATLQETWLDEPGLHDPNNYTVFRRVGLGDRALHRVLLNPPPEPEVKSRYLPDHLNLLYQAWCLLVNSRQEQYDQAAVGLSYTKGGYMFINWSRFFRSSFWPRNTTIRFEDIPRHLAAIKTPNLSNGMLLRDLKPYQPTPLERGRGVKNNPYVTACLYTDGFTLDADTGEVDIASVVDPEWLAEHPQLFDGWKHHKMVQRRRQRATARRLKGATPEQTNAQNAKVSAFTFKPYDLVREYAEEFGVWFPEDHKEIIYAIRRNTELCFTRPQLLKNARRQAPAEVEAWCRALDSLRLVENFHSGGDVGEIHQVSRSQFYSDLRKQKLTEVASDVVEHFVSLDALSGKQLHKVKLELAKRFQEENPGIDSSRWYHEMKMKAAQQFVKLTAVRRIARVLLPGAPLEKPTDEYFYTPLALKFFRDICEGTYGNQRAAVQDNQNVAVLASHQYGRAPYLLAWTRFCLEMQEKGAEYAIPRSRTLWLPTEDVVLLQGFSPGVLGEPRMTPGHWQALLKALPNRARASCGVRATTLRKRFGSLMTEHQAEVFRPRMLMGNEPEAKRLVLIVGYWGTLSKSERKPRTTTVSSLLKLSKNALQKVTLPNTYTGAFFRDLERWAPQAVRR